MNHTAPKIMRAQDNTPTIRSTRSRIKTTLLVIVEVVAIIGVLASAVQMWNVRQELQRDLLVVREAEAALRTGKQTSQSPADSGWIDEAQDTPAEPSVPLPENTKDTEDDGRSSSLPSPSLRSLKESQRSLVSVSISGIYCSFCAVQFAR